MKKQKKTRRNQSGQLSIFAALVFQVLFILFAMSLNVALVIHDKINLQNSVDLAAYYGAMKQAEMLNAIAHINYQIRQSWKLLVWRNRVLGGIGSIEGIPEHQQPKKRDNEEYKPNIFTGGDNNTEGFYVTCIGHKRWYQSNPTADNLCKELNKGIRGPSIPDVRGFMGFERWASQLPGTSRRINALIGDNCNSYTEQTWFFTAATFLHYILDQTHRKRMIHKLAEHLNEGKDLDGNLIIDGVKTTLEKNLSYTNRELNVLNLNPDHFFNSLENKTPENWLGDPSFWTSVNYAEFIQRSGTGGRTNCIKNRKWLYQGIPDTVKRKLISSGVSHGDLLSSLRFNSAGINSLCSSNGPCRWSAGLYKKPEFMIFYGVKAEITYKSQIFFPFTNGITLKAKAFAKPFGGRIGPPVNSTGGRPESADELLPKSFQDVSEIEALNEADMVKLIAPNYSRYPGDRFGVKSHAVQYYWSKFLIYQSNNLKDYSNYWKQDFRNFLVNSKDALAAPDSSPLPPHLDAREWELAAIAPDLFDTTYFTILPSYMQDYYPKIKNIIGENTPYLRPGFSHEIRNIHNPTHSLIYYQTQYDERDPDKGIWAKLKRQRSSLTPDPDDFIPLFERFFYKIQKLEHLMAGWNPLKKKYEDGNDDYGQITKTNFGKCHKWDRDIATHDSEGKIATGCVYGGRTGYSVKMISSRYIENLQNSGRYTENEWPP